VDVAGGISVAVGVPVGGRTVAVGDSGVDVGAEGVAVGEAVIAQAVRVRTARAAVR
jgi:hypothetical protein